MSSQPAPTATARKDPYPSSKDGGSGSALRFSVRMTVSGLAAFAVGQIFTVPLHGLWAVLTAVIVTQASVGGSIRASLEYVLGTFFGAIYASVVSLLIPHGTAFTTAGVLALSIAPLAYAAARSPTFRVAPFTAIIVLLLARQFGQDPLTAATTRLAEVALGGVTAIVVSLTIFPEHSHRRGRQAAEAALDRMAETLSKLLAGFSQKIEVSEINRLQDDIGASVAAFDNAVAEAKHEAPLTLSARPDAGPLSRTLVRLRHDFVIVGRAAADPLPEFLAQRLSPYLTAVGSNVSVFLAACGAALGTRNAPPPRESVDGAIDTYAAEIAAIRSEGLTRTLATDKVEQLFALGFAFDQLRQNLADLERCVSEWTAV